MGRSKITVVGAGNVGATTAQRVVDAELADVVMIDLTLDSGLRETQIGTR